MIPVYYFLKKPKLIFNKEGFLNLLKFYKKYILFQKIPSILGLLLDNFINKNLSKDFVFLRANCDHFGPWISLFLYCLIDKEYEHKFKLCLARKGTINQQWLNYFKINKLIIITNPTLHLLFSPFFFTNKLAYDVNPHVPLSYFLNNVKNRNYRLLKYLDVKTLNSINLPKIKNVPRTVTYKSLLSRKYVLLYARSGLWEFSTNKSKRNMPENIFSEIINFVGKTHNIFLIGDSYKINKLKKDFVFDEQSFSSEELNLPYIYKNAEVVIGSPSGATNFPSLLFNKPTLYICDIPISHILTTYSFKKGWSKSLSLNNLFIPKLDFWLMIGNDNLKRKGFHLIKESVATFLEYKKITLDNLDRDNFENLIRLTSPNKNNGQILIHKSYKYYF